MPTVFLMFQLRIRALARLIKLQLDQVEVSVTPISSRWSSKPRLQRKRIKREEK